MEPALLGVLNVLNGRPAKPTIDRIIRAYAELTQTSIEDLAGPSQAAPITQHRHRLMYLIRKLDPVASYELIGRHLGGRNMGTIHEAVAKVAAAAKASQGSARDLWTLEQKIVARLAGETLSSPRGMPWQILASLQVLRDEQITDAEARKVALQFLSQLEASHGQ